MRLMHTYVLNHTNIIYNITNDMLKCVIVCSQALLRACECVEKTLFSWGVVNNLCSVSVENSLCWVGECWEQPLFGVSVENSLCWVGECWEQILLSGRVFITVFVEWESVEMGLRWVAECWEQPPFSGSVKNSLRWVEECREQPPLSRRVLRTASVEWGSV